MKFREILRFEVAYQLRRLPAWLYFTLLFAFALVMTQIFNPADGVYYGAPSTIAFFSIFGGMIWLLVGGSVAGDAAARDIETRMHPLMYAAPISKTEYLGGRFAAAFVLNALILLALPLGILIGLQTRGLDPALLGPFRPAAYVTAYFFLTLPNAFAVTAIQFAFAVRDRRGIASYLASVLLIIASHFILISVAELVGWRELYQMFELMGIAVAVAMETWSPIEINTRLLRLEGSFLVSRLTWLGLAFAALALTWARFRFEHATPRVRWWRRLTHRRAAKPAASVAPQAARISIPESRRTFGAAVYARQTGAIAWASFRTIARSWTGLTVVGVIALGSALFSREWMTHMDTIPLVATTAEALRFLTPPIGTFKTIWILIPLLTIYYAGELVWRERDAGVSEITDAAPVPEWVLLLGKFLGLAVVVVAWMAFLMAAGMLIQVNLGHRHFEIGLYVRILFGLQLADYLLFAMLVLVIHVVADQKYLGYLAALGAYGFTLLASRLGIEHNLLIFGSDPGWTYTDMPGFGPSLGPWRWFTLYWTGWAILFAVAATLLWTRSKERGPRVRLQQARRRLTRPAAGVAAAALGLILLAGGFVFYNTNVLHGYRSASDAIALRADYERRYARYDGIAQPRLTGTNLHVEIYPSQRRADIKGTYRLVNTSGQPIASIHLAPASGVETEAVTFDRPFARALADDALRHRIYTLESPLLPGDAVQLGFEVHFDSRAFANSGADPAVVANGTYFTNLDWLPSLGYQPNRALTNGADRRLHGLPARPPVPSLDDLDARRERPDAVRIAFDAVIGTDADQIAVAPGTLRKTWTKEGRKYFHYAAESTIGNEYALFSARYDVRHGQWMASTGAGRPVAIEIYHHPSHIVNLDRMMQSVQASLEYYSREFGPYPFGLFRIVEYPGLGRGMHADAMQITHQEGFSLLNPRLDRHLDLPYYIVAHEVAHQWWGGQLAYARVEGAGLLIESLATYSAMRLLEQSRGAEQLGRYLGFARLEFEAPRTRAAPPLLRAVDSFHSYRKGPLSIYALSEYIGQERVHEALRRLLAKHASGAIPWPVSLDLYRELQAVTPDSHRSLLHDLFEKNTFWDLATQQASARQAVDGSWLVTLDITARKVVVDESGVETDVPMDDWVEVGVFADGDPAGTPSYARQHRIRSGAQTVTVTVPRKPARAGVDYRNLLMDADTADNNKNVKIGS